MKNFENLSGGGAVGAAIAVWLTHGDPSYDIGEIAALAAGIGAAITYSVRLIERLLLGEKKEEV